jgi:uncharacterized protein
MSMFQQIAKAATMGAISVLLTAPVAAAEQGGRSWVPKTTSPGPYWTPSTPNPVQYSTTTPAPYSGPITTTPAPYSGSIKTNRARHGRWLVRSSTKRFAATQARKRSALAGMARAVPVFKTHRLILQVKEKMHQAEHKDIPIVSQAQVVESGVVRVMELQEKGWSYVKP